MPKADKPPAAVALVEARKAKGLAQDAVARLIGVPRDTYAKWEKRGTPRPFLARAAHALDATIEALASGGAAGFFSPTRFSKERIATKSHTIEIGGEQYTALPVYDVRAAAGAGVLDRHEEVERHHLFHSQWLRSITTAPAGMLAVIRVSGDSMESTLHNGDHVLIDRTQAAFRRDGIYALDIGDGLQVKRVAMHPINKLLTIKSDNPSYPAWEGIKPDEVRFVGRVIWLGRQV